MTGKLAIATALAAASLACVAAPASAQTYGGITLSFGSGGYGVDDYDNDADYRFGYYNDDSYNDTAGRFDGGYYSDDPQYSWRAHERAEQLQLWRQEQARRTYWQYQQQQSRDLQYNGDDDD